MQLYSHGSDDSEEARGTKNSGRTRAALTRIIYYMVLSLIVADTLKTVLGIDRGDLPRPRRFLRPTRADVLLRSYNVAFLAEDFRSNSVACLSKVIVNARP